MEFGKSFTYVFEDDDWIMKILLAAVITFIPIVGPLAVAGWGVEITKRVIQKDTEPLPGWSDFVNYLIKGLVVMLIGFVYMLPVILVQICASGLLFAGSESGDNTLETVSNIVMVCFSCLTFIYAILMGFLIPAAIGNYASTGEVGAGFRFGEVFGLVKAAPVPYLLVVIGSFLAGLISFLGVIACFIGVFFTSVYASAIIAHLTGQAYHEAKLSLEGNGDKLQQLTSDNI
ncbi:DUF4013 domain-containing protein [Chloroflexota bacterium]